MADKSDKVKKNDSIKKNQPEIRSELSDSSTFSYEVPIPGAAPETIKMSNREYQAYGNVQSWGQEHVQRSVSQLEQILREVVFEFIRECHSQDMDYQEALFTKLSMIDPTIVSWMKLPSRDLAMMESVTLVAEDMISRLASSNWMVMDDRQEILKSIMAQVKTLSVPCTQLLIQESQKLDSMDFVKIKQRKLNHLNVFVQRLRGMMQQWIDMSAPAFMSERAVSAYPPVDLMESQTLVIARVAIPGLKNDQVFASILKGGKMLEISGETPMPTEKSFQNEVPFGKFKRILQLPFQVEEKSLDAAVNLGILTIKMKKAGCTKVDIGV